MVATSYVGCDNTTLAVVLFSLALSITALNMSSYNVNHLDIAPRYAGVLMGITNTAGTIPGMIGPYVVGYLTNNEVIWTSLPVFKVLFIYLFIYFYFLFFFSITVEPPVCDHPKCQALDGRLWEVVVYESYDVLWHLPRPRKKIKNQCREKKIVFFPLRNYIFVYKQGIR